MKSGRVPSQRRGPTGPFLFSTNSFVLGPQALKACGVAVSCGAKAEGALTRIAQFEQLLDDVGLIGALNPVPRPPTRTGSRFVALKTHEAFDAAKNRCATWATKLAG